MELLSQLGDELGTLVGNVASIVKKFPLGSYVPINSMYVFKTDAEVREW